MDRRMKSNTAEIEKERTVTVSFSSLEQDILNQAMLGKEVEDLAQEFSLEIEEVEVIINRYKRFAHIKEFTEQDRQDALKIIQAKQEAENAGRLLMLLVKGMKEKYSTAEEKKELAKAFRKAGLEDLVKDLK